LDETAKMSIMVKMSWKGVIRTAFCTFRRALEEWKAGLGENTAHIGRKGQELMKLAVLDKYWHRKTIKMRGYVGRFGEARDAHHKYR
jgi:hypothetical protein